MPRPLRPVGVLGAAGVVGSALARLLSYHVTTFAWDPARPALGTYRDAALCPTVFVCAPTPTRPGSDAADVTAVVDAVRTLGTMNPSVRIVIVSTIPPTLCAELAGELPSGARLYHAPETCNARTAFYDMAAAQRVVIGSADGGPDPMLETLYCVIAPGAEIRWVPWATAALYKLGVNGFGALKVAYCNELHALCERHGVGYGALRELLCGDGRVGAWWTQVPGPDGELGFGGACLPKDARALAHVADAAGLEPLMLRAALAVSEARRKAT